MILTTRTQLIADKLVGLTKEEAEALLTAGKHVHRIAAEDGKALMLTMDMQVNRFNLSIENGIVKSVSLG
jgi:hypothetical protein